MARTITEVEAENAALKSLLEELRDPRPAHLHLDPTTKVPWTCRSPYCERGNTEASKDKLVDDPRGPRFV